MGARRLWGRDVTLPEHVDIPDWLIDRERTQARGELRACLSRGGSGTEQADRLAHRVVPERSAYARIEREHRAARRGITDHRGEQMSEQTHETGATTDAEQAAEAEQDLFEQEEAREYAAGTLGDPDSTARMIRRVDAAQLDDDGLEW